AGTMPAERLPASTETKLGGVEKATEAEAKAGSANKFPDAAGVLAAFQQFGLGVAGNASEQPLLPSFHNSTIRAGFYRWSEAETENAPSVGGGGAIRLDRGGNRAVWIAASSSGSSNEPELYFKSTGFEVGTWGAWRKVHHSGNLVKATLLEAEQGQGTGYMTPQELHAAFGSGNQSHASNGHQIMPGGTIFQWGAETGVYDGDFVNFNFSFPQGVFRVQVTERTAEGFDYTNVRTVGVEVGGEVPQGFIARVASTNFETINWFAIGH
ncbi:hypothetical protein HZS80_21040, partial [Halomonas glaciei]